MVLDARIWRALALVAAICAGVLLACALQRLPVAGLTRRLMLTLAMAAMFAAVAVGQVVLMRWPPRAAAGLFRRAAAEPAWTAAFTLSAAVAMAGVTVVALLAIYPPPLELSTFKAWDFRDKRWVVAAFLLVNGLVYLPGLFHRMLSPPAADRPLAPAGAPAHRLARGLAAAVAGALLALLLVAPTLPSSVERFLDVHEEVHLGAFQRIAQGAQPYIDARTQYGPGHQLASYQMMQATDVSLRGFRLTQAWMNLLTIAALFALWFYAFGARAGAAMVVLSLALSPLLVATFWGWGIVLRWVAPVVVGTVLPLLLWREVRTTTRVLAVIGLGAACGGLAWMAQENLSGAIMAAGLLLGGAVVRGAIPVRTAIILGAVFVAAEVATLLAVMAGAFGPDHLREAMAFYFLSTGLVFQGMTNTLWNDANGVWKWAYRLTPVLILLITATGLYLRRPAKDAVEALRLGQVLGMAAAAVPLAMVTLFRPDNAHFVGPSTALVPLTVLAVAWLPGRFAWRLDRANLARLGLCALFLVAYLHNPRANLAIRIDKDRTYSDPRRIGDVAATAQGLKLLWSATPFAPPRPVIADPFLRRLGYTPAMDQRCCYNNEWTYGEWLATLREVHAATAGRPVFIDVKLPLESSGLYFLADLSVATPYVSHIMSVWTDDDLRDVEASLVRRPPGCVVSDRPDAVFTKAVLRTYGTYTTTPTTGPTGITIYCAAPAPSVAAAPAP